MRNSCEKGGPTDPYKKILTKMIFGPHTVGLKRPNTHTALEKEAVQHQFLLQYIFIYLCILQHFDTITL